MRIVSFFKSWQKIGLVLMLLNIAGQKPAMGQSRMDSLVLSLQGYGSSAWQLSENPVLLKENTVPQFASAGIFAQATNGSFKRPQDYKTQQLIGFGAKGISAVSDWKFYGEFSYGKHYRDSIRYANVARPYDGNPFITADAVGGNWKGDQLLAKLQVAVPRFGKWQLGLKLDYQTEQSARNNDPKPLYRLLDYSISPSIGYDLNKSNTISIIGSYQNSNEHTETGYYADKNPILYSIRGYGEFYSGPVVTAERFRTGWGWQLGGDYRFRNEKTTFLAGTRVGFRTSDVNDGIAKPIFIGGLDEQRAELFFSLEQRSPTGGWLATLKGWFKDGTGFDPVFGAVNPAYYFSGIDGRVSWSKQKNATTWLSLNLYPSVTYVNYFESIAKTDWTSVMLHNDVGAAINKNLNPTFSVFAELTLGYHTNLQKEIVINRPTILSPILVTPDFSVNSTNYIRTAASVSATYTKNRTSYCLKGGIDLKNAVQQAENLQFGGRNIFNTSLFLIF